MVLKIDLCSKSFLLVDIFNSIDEVPLVSLLLREDSCGLLNARLESFSLSSDLVGEIGASGSSGGLPLSELGCQEALEGLCSGGGTRCGVRDSKVARLGPCDPCGLDSLLKRDSLVVELVEELISVAGSVLVAVVLVLQSLKSSLNSVVLGLNVGKKSSCQVSVGEDGSINLSGELLSFVGGAAILNAHGLFPQSIGMCLLCLFPLANPLKGGGGLGLLGCGHVVDVFLNGVDVFVLEVGTLWALVVGTWLVALVSILGLEEVLQYLNLLIDGPADSLPAFSELNVESFSCIGKESLKISSFGSTVGIAGIENASNEVLEVVLVLGDRGIGSESPVFCGIGEDGSETSNVVDEDNLELLDGFDEGVAEVVVVYLVDPLKLGFDGVVECINSLGNCYFEVLPCSTHDESEGFSLGGSDISKLNSQGVDGVVQIGSLAGEGSVELLTSGVEALLRSFSGGDEESIEVSPGILDGSGECFLGLVDLVEESLLVSFIWVMSVLKLINSILNSSALLGDIAGESFSSLGDVVFGFNSGSCESSFENFAITDESCLKIVAALFKSDLSIVFVGGEVVLKFMSCTIKSNKQVLTDCGKICDEVSSQEDLDFVVSSKRVWIEAMWKMLVLNWVMWYNSGRGMGCLVSWGKLFDVDNIFDDFFVSLVVDCLVSGVAVVLSQPPDPLSDEIVEEGIETIELEVSGSSETIIGGLDISSKGGGFNGAGISKSLKLIVGRVIEFSDEFSKSLREFLTSVLYNFCGCG